VSGADVFVTGLVLAAGASRRLGEPKQLLAYKGTTVLGSTLDMARTCGFDQLVVTVGGASAEVRDRIDFRDCEVIENEQFSTGCSSSISVAIGVVDHRADGIVLLLGDQPDVTSHTVRMVIEAAGASPLGVCRYRDGVGHPFWFRRNVFDDLLALHGDKAVWRLLESGRYPVREVEVAGTIPLDVDTWEDYQTLLAQRGGGASR
jgi:molybdenum cofactor cytidylyltransferase